MTRPDFPEPKPSRCGDRCDFAAGPKTFDSQVSMPIGNRVQCIDHCIHHLVATLNAGNVTTVASCCGHNKQPPSIVLDDDTVILLIDGLDQAGALLSLLAEEPKLKSIANLEKRYLRELYAILKKARERGELDYD